jgi:hypothetical protein
MAESPPRVVDNPGTAYEPADWPLGPVGLIYVGVFVFLVICPLVLMWAYPQTLSDVSRAVVVQPPAPRLQLDPAQELAKFRAEQASRLNTYYWVDKQKGIVHIPIRQAMQDLVKQGIPGFPKAATQ